MFIKKRLRIFLVLCLTWPTQYDFCQTRVVVEPKTSIQSEGILKVLPDTKDKGKVVDLPSEQDTKVVVTPPRIHHQHRTA